MSDQKRDDETPPRPSAPAPVSVAQPWQTDKVVEPTTNPGLKLTAEQLDALRAVDPGAKKAVAATPEYVKAKAKTQKRELQLADVKWFFATIAAIGTFALSGIGFAKDNIKSMIDGGTETPRRDIAELQKNDAKQDAAISEVKNALQHQALEQVRANTMLENLSKQNGLPVPPKVLPPDGGP